MYRWTYNKALSFIKSKTEKKEKFPNIKIIRSNVVNAELYTATNLSWVLNYDYDLRDEAVRDLISNYKTNIAKGNKFDIKFKSKRNTDASISVLAC